MTLVFAFSPEQVLKARASPKGVIRLWMNTHATPADASFCRDADHLHDRLVGQGLTPAYSGTILINAFWLESAKQLAASLRQRGWVNAVFLFDDFLSSAPVRSGTGPNVGAAASTSGSGVAFGSRDQDTTLAPHEMVHTSHAAEQRL